MWRNHLPTRSAAESRLYLELTTCECGEAAYETTAYTVRSLPREDPRPSGLELWTYEATCASCGRQRVFEFRAPARPFPPHPSFGGPEPSQIIDAVQFLGAAELAAGAVPGDPEGLTPDEADEAYEMIAFAIAAVEESLKFIPPGGSAVPRAGLSARSLMEIDRNPERYERSSLMAILDAYRHVHAAYARALDAGTQP